MSAQGMTGTRDRVSNFYTVGLGKIRKSLTAEQAAALEGKVQVTKRTNRNGTDVYELVTDYIAGKLVKLELQDPPAEKANFGKRVAFTLESENGEKAVLYVKWDSAYGRGFMFAHESVDFQKPFEFEPYSYTPKGADKEKMGMNLFQDGQKMDWTMGTRDNSGGCPSLEKITFKGQTQWDNSKQLAFLESKLHDLIAKIDGLNQGSETPAQTETAQTEAAQGASEQEDDVPF
ncbi:hypothetical protein Phi46:1_gp27 [Cellulophaga phage phi46:1]|uniref:hypothetical protein n=1 Tax=Cellulophaga phage phi46:1 TaxID=1327974 RepID=UPI000351F883|nr:hypothetical protein Phi46:1_gp27 [Cellulophaga phage phi46:1]AGO47838.1 hypothetical protein Phi46:1_gp27 [Cellulophaga phage phi46:1]